MELETETYSISATFLIALCYIAWEGHFIVDLFHQVGKIVAIPWHPWNSIQRFNRQSKRLKRGRIALLINARMDGCCISH